MFQKKSITIYSHKVRVPVMAVNNRYKRSLEGVELWSMDELQERRLIYAMVVYPEDRTSLNKALKKNLRPQQKEMAWRIWNEDHPIEKLDDILYRDWDFVDPISDDEGLLKYGSFAIEPWFEEELLGMLKKRNSGLYLRLWKAVGDYAAKYGFESKTRKYESYVNLRNVVVDDFLLTHGIHPEMVLYLRGSRRRVPDIENEWTGNHLAKWTWFGAAVIAPIFAAYFVVEKCFFGYKNYDGSNDSLEGLFYLVLIVAYIVYFFRMWKKEFIGKSPKMLHPLIETIP